CCLYSLFRFFFSSRRRHTRSKRDWSSDVCSSDLSLDQIFPQPNASQLILTPAAADIEMRNNLLRQVNQTLSDKFPEVRPRARFRSEERRVGKEGRSQGWADKYRERK